MELNIVERASDNTTSPPGWPATCRARKWRRWPRGCGWLFNCTRARVQLNELATAGQRWTAWTLRGPLRPLADGRRSTCQAPHSVPIPTTRAAACPIHPMAQRLTEPYNPVCCRTIAGTSQNGPRQDHTGGFPRMATFSGTPLAVTCGAGAIAPAPHSGREGHRNARRTVNRFIAGGLPVRHSSPKTSRQAGAPWGD